MLNKYVRYLIKDQLFTFLAIAFLISYWISAHDLPFVAIQYPIVISVIAVIFIIWNLALSVVNFKKLYAEEGEDQKKWDCTLGLTKNKLVVIGATILYAVLMPVLGYCVTTFCYLTGVSYYMGARKPVKLLAYSSIVLAALYLIFKVGLGVNVPTGLLI